MRLLKSLLIIPLLLAMAWGQTPTSSVRGVVADSHGAVIVGAEVTLASVATGFSRRVKSNDDGSYQFLQAPPGDYTLSAVAPSFAVTTKEGVRLLVNVPATINFILKVQSASTTIEVTGATQGVNTQDATIGHAFGPEQVMNLPMEGRNVTELMSLQPGVAYVGRSDQVNTSSDSRGGAVNGARSDQTNVVLDGVDNNDQLLGFAFQGALRSTPDSLQEFRVTTANSNADTGRSSGGQLSLVTKSGTNSFHGSLYEFHRPTNFVANDWFNKKAQLEAGLPNRPPKFLRNTYGGSLGGPVLKDRLFFFGTYEGQRTRENTQVTRNVPSDSLRNGIIKYVCDSTDPNCTTANPRVTSTPQGLVTTLTPADILAMDPVVNQGVNPNILPILQSYPQANTDSTGDGLNFRGFTFSSGAPENLNTYIAKVDYKITEDGRHSVFFRGNLQHDHIAGRGPNASQFPGQAPNQLYTDTNKGLAANYTGLFGQNLINNFRYGYVRQSGGFRGLNPVHFIQFRGLDSPQGFNRTTATVVPVHNYADDLTWTRGKHTIQVGTNLRIINNIRLSNANSFSDGITNVSWLDKSGIANKGTSFDPAAFGFPAVDPNFASSYDNPMIVLAGIVSEVDNLYNLKKDLSIIPEGAFVRRHFRAHEWEYYGQDAWRITPNLTVTAGLRYTLLQPPYETSGTQVAPTFSLHDWFQRRGELMQSGVVSRPTISFELSGQANGKKPYWNYDRKNFAPRFAFAYSPSVDSGLGRAIFGGAGKTSIRGGYGIFYDHFGEGIVNTFDRNGSFGLSTTLSNPAGTQNVDCAPRLTALTTLPAGTFCGQSLSTPPPSGKFPVTPPGSLFAITWGLDDKLKTPYSQVFNLSVSRELANGFVAEAGYVGRLGRRLLRQKDLAMPLNLVDPASHTDYFTAMTTLVKLAEKGVPIASVGPVPYWENIFPAAAGGGKGAGCGNAAGLGANPSATQNVYDLVNCFLHNETTTLFVLDGISGPCFPACSKFGDHAYFDDQYSSLYAWESGGASDYNAMQLMLRHNGHGLDFNVNYTLSHSFDSASDAERVSLFEGFGFGDQIINSWSPNQLRSSSDFDTRHIITGDVLYDLPVGAGRRFLAGSRGITNALLGNWSVSSLVRWSSGFPVSVGPGLGFWATNWELTGNVLRNGTPVTTGTFLQANHTPNLFKNGTAAVNAFRFAYPGESGDRNNLRGPGYFGLDLGLSKSWKIHESQSLQIRAEAFNVTNSVRFDVGSIAGSFNLSLVNNTSFGNYTSTLTKPRIMQFSGRYSF